MRSVSSCGTEYLPETTRICRPLKYNAATKALGADGSCAAMLSRLPASSAAASCRASGADLESCAKTDDEHDRATTTTKMERATRVMGPPWVGKAVLSPNRRCTQSLNEEGVVVFTSAPPGVCALAELAQDPESGAKPAQKR